MRLTPLAALCAAAASAAAHAQPNLINNGSFESGNAGFGSDYGYSATTNCCEGQYTVRGNPAAFNGSFVQPPPSNPTSGQMMVINGSTVPNLRVWFQTVAVEPGHVYTLELHACTAVLGGPAVLQWRVGGELIGIPLELPDVTAAWNTLGVGWIAPPGVTSIEVAIRDLNTSTFPNDFYLDDLTMTDGGFACLPDLGTAGGIPGHDGVLNNNDFIAFINYFFAADPHADFGRAGGLRGSDGLYNNNDFIAYITAFFNGCN